ncbi:MULTISPECIES: DUF6056 family protein [Chryseobacterium]|uniref:Glucosyltransferase GtrII-like protein n=1 Tax=Chryseobacterium geocarposphaerae TaxID=1416776 RepID=A0ABU1LE79_9FLAO|nr:MULTISPECIES: DUF6056 family protein [Chryseobacterium]MDR6405019.1 hypothetical protein [Chryseobacterium geocarposphaerae]MDR6697802.1 hypothetical protein [Chryseobacterium ginsenosidimutans]
MKLVQNIILFLSILLCIGLVYIAFFNVYQTDDYIYSWGAKRLGIIGNSIDFYTNWGGRYFGYTLNMLNPVSQDPENILPKLYPIFLFSTFIGVSALNFKQYFKYSFSDSLVKGFLLFFFYTTLLISISEHYYWISGANIYFIPLILSGFLLLFYGKFQESGKMGWFLLSAVLVAILMGSNEILALILLGALIVLNYQIKSKENRILLIIGTIGFLISFLAPGNFKRLADSTDIFYIKWAKRVGVLGANTIYIAFKTVLVLPLFIKVFEKELQIIIKKISFKKAVLIWAISFLPLLFTGYIMNTVGRQFENIIFFFLLTFSVVMMFRWKGIKKFWGISFIVVFLPQFNILPERYSNFNIDYNLSSIVKEILYTDLKTYDQEIANRISAIKNSKEDSLILNKIKTFPNVLYFDEMSSVNEDKKYVNDQLQKYFNKKYIRTE